MRVMTDFSSQDSTALQERFLAVQDRLERAAQAGGRARADISLLAVSKIHPPQAVAALADFWASLTAERCGVPAFGENYIREALEKQAAVAGIAAAGAPEWHFIGHVQSRKAKDVAGRFRLVHTLDSIKLARNLHKALKEDAAAGREQTQDVLVQVNVGREAQKSGVLPEDAPALLEELRALPQLVPRGLMCIPPFGDSPETSRPHFAALRELRDRLEKQNGLCLPHLSMGMSHDFELAIREGATIVRVGTDIFGARPRREG